MFQRLSIWDQLYPLFRNSYISKSLGAITEKNSNCSLNYTRMRIIKSKNAKAFRMLNSCYKVFTSLSALNKTSGWKTIIWLEEKEPYGWLILGYISTVIGQIVDTFLQVCFLTFPVCKSGTFICKHLFKCKLKTISVIN